MGPEIVKLPGVDGDTEGCIWEYLIQDDEDGIERPFSIRTDIVRL